ncbi:MAG: phosphate ABC transporter permease PstA, partial [Clostridia bacterium]|nr:phosphate ABC transporter permease PstA [Clostridia bacterium]
VGEPGGGMANAVAGTFIMVGLAALLGLPVGIMAGIYLAEYGRGRLADVIRFMTDVFTGVPSVVIGVFIYTVVVTRMGSFSALAGGLALSLIIIPLVTRTTEELLRMVPYTLREASLALGATKARTIVSVVLRSAAGGVVTGVMLAIARAAGETAPLLFTALSSRHWSLALREPMASLPVYIYTYAISPFRDWQVQAWGAALVLLLTVLGLNLVARAVTRSRYRY